MSAAEGGGKEYSHQGPSCLFTGIIPLLEWLMPQVNDKCSNDSCSIISARCKVSTNQRKIQFLKERNWIKSNFKNKNLYIYILAVQKPNLFNDPRRRVELIKHYYSVSKHYSLHKTTTSRSETFIWLRLTQL